jgi:hypothetical protein
MDKANRPIVGDGLGTLLLWKQHNAFLVESIEVFGVVVGHSAMRQPPMEKIVLRPTKRMGLSGKKNPKLLF